MYVLQKAAMFCVGVSTGSARHSQPIRFSPEWAGPADWPVLTRYLCTEPKSSHRHKQECHICHPNWVKLAPECQNVLKLILKCPRFVPFGADLTQFGCQIWHRYSHYRGPAVEMLTQAYNIAFSSYPSRSILTHHKPVLFRYLVTYFSLESSQPILQRLTLKFHNYTQR